MDLTGSMTWILRAHAISTVMLAGLIWTIQLVHYPLFAKVGADRWMEYERLHQMRITTLVGPLMLAELVTAALLLAPLVSGGKPAWLPIIGAGLLAVIWASTFFIQVPIHSALERGFDPVLIERLVATNWIRTIAWTARAVIAIELLRTAAR
jgi:hypothetical protein